MVNTQDIQTAEQILIQNINDLHPDVDTRKGTAFRKLVISPTATLYALIKEEISKLQSAYDIDLLDLEDDSVLEAVLSNWFLTRDDGTKARGIIRIVLAEEETLIIEDGTTVSTENDIQFIIVGDHTYSPNPEEDEEKIFFDAEESVFFVLAPVEAVAVGADGNISPNTILAGVDNSLLTGILFIESYGQFSGGTDPETIEEFRSRVNESIVVRNLTSKKSIKATLKDQFPDIRKVVPIGYNDLEMQRDVVFPTQVHTGGAIDVYTANAQFPVTVTKEAIISSPPIVEIFGKEAPVLRLKSVRLDFGGELVFLEEGSDYVVEQDSFNWYINFTEALIASKFYARFSTKELTRITLITGNLVQDESEYLNRRLLIEYDTDPVIHNIQSFMDEEETRVLMASYLSKTLAPIFLRVTLKYQGEVDETVLRQQISDYISGIDSENELVTVSKIVAIAESLGVKRVILPVEIEGEAVTNFGEIIPVFTTDELEIPEKSEFGYTAKIVQYYCHPEIDITLVKEV